MVPRLLFLLAAATLLPGQPARTELTLHLETPMAPPAWALLERDLLR